MLCNVCVPVCIFVNLSRSVCVHVCVFVCVCVLSIWRTQLTPGCECVCESVFPSFMSVSLPLRASAGATVDPLNKNKTSPIFPNRSLHLLLLFLLLAGLQSILLTARLHFASNWLPLFLLASSGFYWPILLSCGL